MSVDFPTELEGGIEEAERLCLFRFQHVYDNPVAEQVKGVEEVIYGLSHSCGEVGEVDVSVVSNGVL